MIRMNPVMNDANIQMLVGNVKFDVKGIPLEMSTPTHQQKTNNRTMHTWPTK